jgi:cytochrome c-type biogenesis protein CcmE
MTTTAPDPTQGPDAEGPDPVPRRGRASLRVVVCVAIILAALGWIAVRGLTGSFVYYLTPSEVVDGGQAEVSQRIRLGGYVEPGSVRRDEAGLSFTVSDGKESVRVVSTGSVPQMFRAGQGVVLEGALNPDGLFHADTLLVKHDGEYRAPDPATMKGP